MLFTPAPRQAHPRDISLHLLESLRLSPPSLLSSLRDGDFVSSLAHSRYCAGPPVLQCPGGGPQEPLWARLLHPRELCSGHHGSGELQSG